jgi:hypothetical protein
MLTLALALTAFAWRHQPLAECSCCIRSHVDPDGPCCRCHCYRCRCLHVIIVIVVAVVVVTATPTIAELTLQVELLRCHFPPR